MGKPKSNNDENPYAPPRASATQVKLERKSWTSAEVVSAIIFTVLLVMAIVCGLVSAVGLINGQTADAGGQFFLAIIFATAAVGYRTKE